MCFFAFFGAKIWPAAAGPGELARDLRDQTLKAPGPEVGVGAAGLRPQPRAKHGPVRAAGASGPLETPSLAHWQFAGPDLRVAFKERFPRSPRPLQSSELETTVLW